jgi:3-hydroxyacyl-CoA dehydrogenase/enoyl-CoA hydratase/3-hydroxybutyryl-CoA epimerase
MGKTFRYEEADNGEIGIVYFDAEGERVNKLSTAVMMELERLVGELRQKELKCLLFMSAKKDIFCVGANIDEIKDIKDFEIGYQAGRRGQMIFQQVSELPYPTVAVIDGACMGGATELSLAMDYRAAGDNDKTKIALPEIKLGILPGWGGTQRLPKLIGLQRSLDVILSGKNLSAKKAWKLGIVDTIVPTEWLKEKAIEFAREIIAGRGGKYKKRRKPRGMVNAFLENTFVGRRLIFSAARKNIMKLTRGLYPAPLKALEVIEKTASMPLEDGLEIEAKALGELLITPQSKNLVQLFFWMDEIKKENGTDRGDIETKEILSAVTLGAGVMGGGIAQLFASKGIDIRVKDINYNAVTMAYRQAKDILKKQLKRRRITKFEYLQTLHRISATVDFSGFKNSDVIIEAIVEDLNIKKAALAELEKRVKEDAIIATNTSSLRVDDMAEALTHKERFTGMHFFNPVHKMPLVEVVRGKHTSDETLAAVFKLALRLGKTPIVVNDGPGFLVNRLLLPYMVEAVSLLEEGYSIKKIDKAMLDFGMPMGPIELFDEVGLDVAYKVAKILRQTMSDRMAESDILEKMTADKRFGKKNGVGFYRYEGKKKIDDPSVSSYITVKNKTDLTEEELIQRMIYPMVNEAARCLEEGIVRQARDVDIGMIFGTGFAPFRGGLLKYADDEGVVKIIERLKIFEEKYGSRFKPSEALKSIEKFY